MLSFRHREISDDHGEASIKCIPTSPHLQRLTVAALKSAYGLSMVNNRDVKSLTEIIPTHETLNCRSDLDSISTANMFLNTFKVDGKSVEGRLVFKSYTNLSINTVSMSNT